MDSLRLLPTLLRALIILSLSLSTSSAFITNSARSIQLETVHTFPLGSWNENLAVRQSGEILLTFVEPAANLQQVDPTKPEGSNVQLVHTFESVTSTLGIAEGAPDIFYVAGGNISYTSSGELVTTPGSFSIWSVDFRNCKRPQDAKIQKVVDIPQAKLLNGITFVNRYKGILLIADSQVGVIYSLNVYTKALEVAIAEPATVGPELGVNGVKVNQAPGRNPELFFTNSQNGTLFRQMLNENGNPIGKPSVVYRSSPEKFEPDDFALRPNGDEYIANPADNMLVFHSAGSSSIHNVTHVPAPTAAQFGRSPQDVKNGVLYISSTGGDEQYAAHNITVAGALYKISV